MFISKKEYKNLLNLVDRAIKLNNEFLDEFNKNSKKLDKEMKKNLTLIRISKRYSERELAIFDFLESNIDKDKLDTFIAELKEKHPLISIEEVEM